MPLDPDGRIRRARAVRVIGLRFTPERFEGLRQANPEAVLELASPAGEGPGGLTALRRKMAADQRNGARLGWLLIPAERAVGLLGPADQPAELVRRETVETLSIRLRKRRLHPKAAAAPTHHRQGTGNGCANIPMDGVVGGARITHTGGLKGPTYEQTRCCQSQCGQGERIEEYFGLNLSSRDVGILDDKKIGTDERLVGGAKTDTSLRSTCWRGAVIGSVEGEYC